LQFHLFKKIHDFAFRFGWVGPSRSERKANNLQSGPSRLARAVATSRRPSQSFAVDTISRREKRQAGNHAPLCETISQGFANHDPTTSESACSHRKFRHRCGGKLPHRVDFVDSSLSAKQQRLAEDVLVFQRFHCQSWQNPL
jgi:hypothetical protein